MPGKDIEIGRFYLAKVNARVVTVRVDDIAITRTGAYQSPRAVVLYRVTNMATGRKTVFRSAAKFRAEVTADGKVMSHE